MDYICHTGGDVKGREGWLDVLRGGRGAGGGAKMGLDMFEMLQSQASADIQCIDYHIRL